MITTEYVTLNHAVADEVSITTHEDGSKHLIFFAATGGRRGRAVKHLVEELHPWSVEYEPCRVYRNVPVNVVCEFVDRYKAN